MRRALHGFGPVLLPCSIFSGPWGGKGGGIQRLQKWGLPTPRTAVLPLPEVNEWIRALPGHTPALASWRRWSCGEEQTPLPLERFRETILQAPPPQAWNRRCRELLKKTAGAALIVRSSTSIDHDPSFDFQGSFAFTPVTFLDSTSVWKATRQVLASAFSREAALRVLASETRLGDFIPGALIQEQVPWKLLGTCLSRDPFEPWKAQGTVQWSDAEGRTFVAAQGDRPPLTLSWAWDELWEAVQRTEGQLGRPVRLEWAWDGRRLLFLQLDPIATEEARIVSRCASTGRRWKRASERFPEPLTPMSWSTLLDTLPEGRATSVRGWIYSAQDALRVPLRLFHWGVLAAAFRFTLALLKSEDHALPMLRLDVAVTVFERELRKLREGWPRHLQRYQRKLNDFSQQLDRRGGTPNRSTVLAQLDELRALTAALLEPEPMLHLIRGSLENALAALQGRKNAQIGFARTLQNEASRMDEELQAVSQLSLEPQQRLILKAGQLLAKDQDLHEPQEVFFLKLRELRSHLRESGPTLRFLARRRKLAWRQNREQNLPPQFPASEAPPP